MTHPLVQISWRGRPVQIEHAWVGDAHAPGPLLVFLHEGLGSVAMWRDFPAQLCAALGLRGLVYSRPAYGRSTPRQPDEHWDNSFLHQQALEVLPALLQALHIDRPYALLGHSDGGSIALLHAAKYPAQVAATIVMAPHILVEEFGLVSIRQAREQYLSGGLRERLARYHDDVDSAFWGWNDVWLSARFPEWQIAAELCTITHPVLAIQGEDDPYGTMAQIDGIARVCPQTVLCKLPACGHSPHRDQSTSVITAIQAFFQDIPQALQETTT